jgi:Zn-dependent protease
MDGIPLDLIRSVLISFVVLLCSLCVREWAHAFIAEKLGDPTPRMDGRLTLNPFAHFDLVGTLIFPVACLFFLNGHLLFGWAKPVLTNPSYFKHQARDSMLVAVAGPLANFAIAGCAAIVGRLMFAMAPSTSELFGRVLLINVVLAVINLLPIPPLDGSQLLRYFTGMREETFMRLSQWSGLIILAIFFIPALNRMLGMLINIGLLPFLLIFPEARYGFPF